MEAEKLGMVYKLCSSAYFESDVRQTAETLAKMPTRALGYTKRLLNKSMSNSLEEQLVMESELQIASAQSEDYAEGVAAFVEKRKPNFKGR